MLQFLPTPSLVTMLQPEWFFKKCSHIRALIFSKPISIKAKFLPWLLMLQVILSLYSFPSFFTSCRSLPCSLHSNHPCLLAVIWTCYGHSILGSTFVFALCSTCDTPLSDIHQPHPLNATRSLLKCYPTAGTLLFPDIKGQCPPRHPPLLYPGLYFLCSSSHHLHTIDLFAYLFIVSPPLECRFHKDKDFVLFTATSPGPTTVPGK